MISSGGSRISQRWVPVLKVGCHAIIWPIIFSRKLYINEINARDAPDPSITSRRVTS